MYFYVLHFMYQEKMQVDIDKYIKINIDKKYTFPEITVFNKGRKYTSGITVMYVRETR